MNWIKVEDGLPSPYRDVLITNGDDTDAAWWFNAHADVPVLWRASYTGGLDFEWQDNPPTHWAELPELPK